MRAGDDGRKAKAFGCPAALLLLPLRLLLGAPTRTVGLIRAGLASLR